MNNKPRERAKPRTVLAASGATEHGLITWAGRDRPLVEFDFSAPQQHLFARGYVISDAPEVWVPRGWSALQAVGWHVHYDPRSPVVHEVGGDVEILCLGVIHDARDPVATSAQFVHSLAVALARSETAFFEVLAYAGGRHIILCRRGADRPFLLTDATAMKSAFRYDGERRLVASHANLIVANAAGAIPRPPVPYQFGYPGLRTPLSGVYFVTPNTRLDLDTFIVSRFWPTTKPRSMTLAEAIEEAAFLMGNSFTWISQQFHPVISVSAGIDSRVALAFTRGSASRYFTFWRSDSLETDWLDKQFGTTIAALGLIPRHDLIDKATIDLPNDVAKVMAQNSYYLHLPQIAHAYGQLYGADPLSVHVRSNLSEIGRRYYEHTRPSYSMASPRDLARLWLPKRFDPGELSPATDAFAEFDQLTGLMSCAGLIDPASLFYWEHRMGVWHSQIVIGTDAAFDTLSLYNCRRLLEVLLSVSPEAQRGGFVHRGVVRRIWPQLAQFPVNGKPFDERLSATMNSPG